MDSIVDFSSRNGSLAPTALSTSYSLGGFSPTISLTHRRKLHLVKYFLRESARIWGDVNWSRKRQLSRVTPKA